MVDIALVNLEHGQQVRVAGVLDVRTAADTRILMHRIVDGATGPILLDLADCQVRDSTAFGLLVELRLRAGRAHRPLRITAADERTRRLLRRARLANLLVDEPARSASAPVRVTSVLAAT